MLKARLVHWTIAVIIAAVVLAAPAAALAQDDDGESSGGGLIIKAIEIKGNENISDRDILGVMKGRAGSEFSANVLFDDLNRIKEMGYFHATPTQIKEPLEGGVKIIIIVEENPNFTGFHAQIIGVPIYTSEEVRDTFFQEYTLPVGEIINNNNLIQSYQAI